MHNYRNRDGFWNFGRVYAGLLMALKFVFIAACFTVALASFFVCRSRRDWFFLTLGLAFTLGADYFLILHSRHLIGVAVFCFAHVAYIVRAVSSRPGGWRRLFLGLAVFVLGFIYFALVSFVLDWLIAFRITSGIFAFAALYAGLFITNIYVSARYIRHNRVLVIAGLLLFAACDICVLIFNLPFYMGAPAGFTAVFPLIWVFYLPAQALLAVSAVDFAMIRRRAANLISPL